MSAETKSGRLAGALVLAHLALGLTTPFILLHPLVRSDWATAAAASATQIRIAVLLFFAGSAMPIAITGAAWDVLRQRALWLFALAVAAFTLQAVDNAHILSMLSFSQQHLQMPAIVVSTARKWSHYTTLLVEVSWILLFFALLYRFRLVPRLLAGLGVVTSAMQIGGVTLPALCGLPPQLVLAMPLAPVYVGLALWLLIKGFPTETRA